MFARYAFGEQLPELFWPRPDLGRKNAADRRRFSRLIDVDPKSGAGQMEQTFPRTDHSTGLNPPDLRRLFESVPGLYLVLLPVREFTIVAASDAYLKGTMTTRETIVGRALFEVFPDNPADPEADGMRNLRASLMHVIETGQTDAMAVQEYDTRRPDGSFERRYWSPLNCPVLDQQENCLYIIHRVEDVTEFVRLKEQEVEQSKRTEELTNLTASMEAEIFHRSRELEETNRQLREANRELQALWQSSAQQRTEAELQKSEALDILRRTQEQLLQAQKLEAVGRLAGGVSHDFNNLLTAIIGYADLGMHHLDRSHAAFRHLSEIRQAGERAAGLTRQLLAFSRKQVMQPRILDVNELITNLYKMLGRMIGEDYEVRTVLDPETGNIKADPGQVEQVIMNLVVNARDAMPDGGKVGIETRNIYLDETYAREHISVVSGWYVMIAISDVGTGMDQETLQHIFELLFTTKEAGKGTGLGLSTVYGIVKQSGGNIWVYSEPGKGTTFKVYFPLIKSDDVDYPNEGSETKTSRGTETVLLVEDAEFVRNLAKEILQQRGYNVLDAADAATARLVCAEYAGNIDLLLTDVVMPEISGNQLARQLLKFRPEMKVVYMSGYTEDAIVNHGVLAEGVNFIQKPFTPDTLTFKVREALQ